MGENGGFWVFFGHKNGLGYIGYIGKCKFMKKNKK
jgi:hypothetical protein